MSGPVASVLRHLRRLAGQPEAAADSDRQLLERFAARRDEAAFATVLERHGPMVRGVCRRVLRDEHEADDAFQATFLVLARKAAGVSWHESVGGWLHEAAYRIAVKARGVRARATELVQRRTLLVTTHSRGDEPPGQTSPPARQLETSAPEEAAMRQELRAILDEELARLPEKYRLPLVLCYLEGRGNEEAAQDLGWSKGTLSGRISRARDLLRRRLIARGVTLSAAALGVALPEATAAAALPSALVDATLKAAVLFAAHAPVLGVVSAKVVTQTEGMLQAMFHTKLRTLAVGLLATCLLAGGAFLAYAAFSKPGDEKKTPGPVVGKKPAEKPQTDLDKLQGPWHIVAVESRGKLTPKDRLEELARRVIVKNARFTELDGDFGPEYDLKLDPTQNPKTIDWLRTDVSVEAATGVRTERIVLVAMGIYELEGDTLRIAHTANRKGRKRPTEFKTGPDSAFEVITYQRGEPPDRPDKEKRPAFIEAEVTLHSAVDFGGPDQELKKKVKDKAALARLIACFPQLARGKKNSVFGGWLPSSTIKFTGSKGESVTIKVSHNFDHWSEGHGDWQVKANLVKLVGELFELPLLHERGLFMEPWRVVAFEEGGKKHDVDSVSLAATFQDFALKASDADVLHVEDYSLDPSKKPKQIDLHLTFGAKGKSYLGIYALEGDTLKIRLDKTGKKRPAEFSIEAGDADQVLLILERAAVLKKGSD